MVFANRAGSITVLDTGPAPRRVLPALSGSTAITTSSLKQFLLAIAGVFRRGGQCNFGPRRPLLSLILTG
jgi:hypothetical protein